MAKQYNRGPARGNAMEEYDYLDENGQPYMRVIRTTENTFPVMKWVEEIGEWKYGMPDGPPIPYNLPDVLSAKEVYICEGEKDANTITKMGLVGTTNCGGAGKWATDLNKYFSHNQTVYILGDNDEPGRAHAKSIAIGLGSIVKVVKVIFMPQGKDITEWITDHGGDKAKLIKLCKDAKKSEIKIIEIVVKDGEISKIVDKTQNAIIEMERPVYVRGGILVEPIWHEYPISNGNKTKVTIFKMISTERLWYMINKHDIIFKRYDGKKKDMVIIDPPAKAMNTLIALGHWGFPRVSGIINAPTLRPDGSILSKKGYDQATQLWCHPDENIMMPKTKEKPTKKDALEALKLFEDLLSGFAFESRVDFSVAVAGIIGAVCRGAYDVAPMILFLAHMPGSGKSFLVDVISSIVRGRACPVTTASKNEEEMEKRLGALLLESPSMISLDNMSFNIRSDLLCSMCSQQMVKVRILGKSEAPDCEWKGSLFATGNNISYSGDMTRRGLICNLDPGVERPELREFDFDPIDRVLKDRGKYIAAALTLVRGYLNSGVELDCLPLGSYSGWSRFVREPLIWLGEEDPVRSMDQALEDDPVKSSAENLFELMKQHVGLDKPIKANEIIDLAKEQISTGEFGAGVSGFARARPELFDLLVERSGDRGQIDPRRFGLWLRSLKGQIYNGTKLLAFSESTGHGNRWIWKANKVQ